MISQYAYKFIYSSGDESNVILSSLSIVDLTLLIQQTIQKNLNLYDEVKSVEIWRIEEVIQVPIKFFKSV